MVRLSPREWRFIGVGSVALAASIWLTWPKSQSSVGTGPGQLVNNAGNVALQESQFNKPAPNLTLSAIDGTSFSVQAQADNPVVIIVFWRTDCLTCLDQLNEMSTLAADFGNHLFAINVGESATIVESWLKEHPQKVRIILDPASSSSGVYATSPLPTSTYLHAGKVVGFGIGKLSADQLRKKITSLTALE